MTDANDITYSIFVAKLLEPKIIYQSYNEQIGLSKCNEFDKCIIDQINVKL